MGDKKSALHSGIKGVMMQNTFMGWWRQESEKSKPYISEINVLDNQASVQYISTCAQWSQMGVRGLQILNTKSKIWKNEIK